MSEKIGSKWNHSRSRISTAQAPGLDYCQQDTSIAGSISVSPACPFQILQSCVTLQGNPRSIFSASNPSGYLTDKARQNLQAQK